MSKSSGMFWGCVSAMFILVLVPFEQIPESAKLAYAYLYVALGVMCMCSGIIWVVNRVMER